MDNSFWLGIAKSLISLFMNKEKKSIPIEASVSIAIDGPKVEKAVSQNAPNMEFVPSTAIDWESASCNITTHFLVGDAIALHSWDRLATPDDGLTDEIKTNIVNLCNKMEEIRKVLNCPVNVHCIFRSVLYNEQVLKSLPHDVHSMGLAIDMDCNGHHTIQEIKDILVPLLEQYSIRLEKGTTTWVHLDMRKPGPSGRYFTP